VYCTGNVDTRGTRGKTAMGWRQAERMRESPRKEYGKERGKQTGCKGSKKDHNKLWENNVWGGIYNPEKRGERKNHHIR